MGDAHRQPRRWPWVVGFGGMLIGAIIAVEVGAHSYKPIEAGSIATFPDASLTMPKNPGFDEETYVLPYRHEQESDISFSIRNSGRYSVLITDVPDIHRRTGGLLTFEAALLGNPFDPTAPSKPFSPFRLGPGDEALITLRGIFFNCDLNGPDIEQTMDSFEITYRFLWTTREERIFLPAPLRVVSPPDAGCPLKRSFDNSRNPEIVPPLPARTP